MEFDKVLFADPVSEEGKSVKVKAWSRRSIIQADGELAGTRIFGPVSREVVDTTGFRINNISKDEDHHHRKVVGNPKDIG